MLGVAEASARILEHIHTLPPERVGLRDALGRVLATPIVAPLTLPPWDNSGMDGYAVRAADVEGATADSPATLRVVETVAAGEFPSRGIGAGEATRVMTGAPVPAGADTVIRVEDTDGGTETVVIRNVRDLRHNVRPRGEDLREGDTVLEAGTPLGAAQIGVLASVGAASVDVVRRPRVAILSSGDELVDLDRFHLALAGRKIVSSNSYSLHALVRAAGAEPVDLGLSPDSPDALRAHLERATACDMLLTSAGVSVGEFDYVREVVAELGAELKLWRVRMRPGAPIAFGMLPSGARPESTASSRERHGIPWIGLPGNPVSTMVTFELFVRPALRRMMGHERLFRRTVPAVLEEPVTLGARLTHFLRVVLTTRDDGRVSARLTGPQGSGILTSMARANALLVVPEDRQRVEAGEVLNAIPLTEDAGMSASLML